MSNNEIHFCIELVKIFLFFLLTSWVLEILLKILKVDLKISNFVNEITQKKIPQIIDNFFKN